jgi:metal-responsive CopG/Arc/MetJ family transcriptional regulator
MVRLLDQAVREQDTDRSKFLRSAVRKALGRAS